LETGSVGLLPLSGTNEIIVNSVVCNAHFVLDKVKDDYVDNMASGMYFVYLFIILYRVYMFYINFNFIKCHTHYFIINIPFILIMIFS